MTKRLDLTGRHYGKLTVLHEGPKRKRDEREWLCACACGGAKLIRGSSLRSGRTKSCGCVRKQLKNNALSRMPEYKIYRGIIMRCENENVKAYPSYGGRGIKISPKWRHDFQKFFKDMGPRPSDQHSIERIDNDRGYEPGNCCWALNLEQVNNRRNTRYVTYRGERLPLTEAVRMAGSVIHREAAWIRITKCGWSAEEALETPRLHLSPASRRRRVLPAPQRRAA